MGHRIRRRQARRSNVTRRQVPGAPSIGGAIHVATRWYPLVTPLKGIVETDYNSLGFGVIWSETLLVYLEDYSSITKSNIATSVSSVCLYRFDPHVLVCVAPVLNLATEKT
jgi:hypothetical protein